MLEKIIERGREPSTWAGLSVLGVLFGIRPEEINAVVQLLTAGAAAAAVFLREKK